MGDANITPFGVIRPYQTYRLLRGEIDWVRSTFKLRPGLFFQAFKNIVDSYPEVKSYLEQALLSKGSDINVPKNLYSQLNRLLEEIDREWGEYRSNAFERYSKHLKHWQSSARRGYLRFILMLTLLVISTRYNYMNSFLSARGIGGKLKNKLHVISNGMVRVRAGSLYVALDALEHQDLIENFRFIRVKDASVKLSVKLSSMGNKIISEILELILDFFKKLGSIGIFSVIDQAIIDNIDDYIPTTGKLFRKIDYSKEPVDISLFNNLDSTFFKKTRMVVDKLKAMGAEHLDSSKQMNTWKMNFNRGMTDIFVLGRLLLAPTYGRELIREAEDSLGFKAGTIYPKIEKFIKLGFIRKIEGDEIKSRLESSNYPRRGPEKKFYDITLQGAFYFTLIFTLFIKDFSIVFKLIEEFLENEARFSSKKSDDEND
ncbi:MAG: PadR family transcriptional regulator [Promethearchaeota archaeon]